MKNRNEASPRLQQVAVLAVGIAGLFVASLSALYIAGLFGISASLAGQIVNAVSVGGWVLAIVMGGLSGGFASVAIATAKWAIGKWGKTIAAA